MPSDSGGQPGIGWQSECAEANRSGQQQYQGDSPEVVLRLRHGIDLVHVLVPWLFHTIILQRDGAGSSGWVALSGATNPAIVPCIAQ
jgi:hypothetical protein